MEPETLDQRPRKALLLIGIAALVILAVSLFLLPLGGGDGDSNTVVGGHPLYGKPAPEIELETLDGQQVALSSLVGRPVILNFWASWCAPCREEFPLMVETYAAHADDGLEILGIIHEDSADKARAFATEQSASWPMLLDTEGAAWDAYRGVGLPTSFFVDPDGIVRAFSLGPFSEAGLERQLATIIPVATPRRSSTAGSS